MTHIYRDRRYRVIDGVLKKNFVTPPEEGWYETKAEAWEAWNEAVAAAPEPSQATTTSIGYGKRRYLVVDGKLQKRWDADPRWYVSKADALAAHQAEVEAAAAKMTSQPTAPETPATPPEPGDGATPEPEVPEPAAETPAGTEPAPEPEPPDRAAAQKVLRVPAVIELTGMSRTTIYRKVKAGKFVQPLDLGNGHVGFLESQILDWQRDQSAAAQAPELEGAA